MTKGKSALAVWRFALTNSREALELARDGLADAVAFTPFNKHAMRLFEPSCVDEIEIIGAELGGGAGREFNVLDHLSNARITSHVPLSKVASLITRQSVLNGLILTDRCMREVGFPQPHIAVAALNPHAGDGGNFGHEDDAEIVPAVAGAKARGILCEGPFPSDTVFLRAKRGDFDAIQTMYHDQVQIAIKLMDFEKGVTLIGGYKVRVRTPAHGTAYDIAGKSAAGATPGAQLVRQLDLDERRVLLTTVGIAILAAALRIRAWDGNLDRERICALEELHVLDVDAIELRENGFCQNA